MFRSFFSNLFKLILMLSLLNGCDSSDDSSNLLSGGSSPAGESVSVVHSLTLLASPLKQIANGTNLITLTVITRDEANIPMSDVSVSMSADSNTAIFDQGIATTSAGGTVTFLLTNSVVETVTITAIAGEQTAFQSVNFLDSLSENVSLNISVIDDEQIANGQDAIQIDMIARNPDGSPATYLPILVRFPSNSMTKSNPSQGITDLNGSFTTEITSSEPGDVIIRMMVENTSFESQQVITFLAEAGENTKPGEVYLEVSNNEQAADGQSAITLIVTPRDAQGVALKDVNVSLIDDSDHIDIMGGKTNAFGQYIVKITSLQAETFQVMATVNDVQSSPVKVTFLPAPHLIVTVLNDNQVANGSSIIQLNVLAKDEDGQAISDTPLVVKISGAVVANPAQGNTDENGVFIAELTSTEVGDFQVTVAFENNPLNSSTKTVTFIGAPAGETIENVIINLITSESELGSVGDSTGITITAFLLNAEDNNPVDNVAVNFSSCLSQKGSLTCSQTEETNLSGVHGEIQAIKIEKSAALAGLTDVSGRAQARLTTQINHDNRTLLVTASALGNTNNIEIDVTGTTITMMTDTQNIVQGETANISIFLKDSVNSGINEQTLNVSSKNGNDLCWVDNDQDSCTPGVSMFSPNINVVSNISGQAIVKLIGTNTDTDTNTDTITASKELTGSNSIIIKISDDNFILTSSTEYPIPKDFSEVTEIELAPNTQSFLVHWDRGGVVQVGATINISSTRGTLYPSNQITTNEKGDATFQISAPDIGNAVITASANEGPAAKLTVEFISTTATTITLQANPVTLGVNTPGSDTMQSEIIAVVRDANNNLVKGKLINFSVEDITGGRLSLGSGVTDSFGRASTVYIAGITSSAFEGIKVTAEVIEDPLLAPPVNSEVSLTVAGKSLFVTLGTTNKIEVDEPLRYRDPFTALVTDAAGVAITEAEIIISILPIEFAKGQYRQDFLPILELTDVPVFDSWAANKTARCPNEDRQFENSTYYMNGILDPGEDTNLNGALEPGNVATFENGGVINTVTTDANGFADFFVVYPKLFAEWVKVEVTATVIVEGTEGQTKYELWLNILNEDVNSLDVFPAGFYSPFGQNADCSSVE